MYGARWQSCSGRADLSIPQGNWVDWSAKNQPCHRIRYLGVSKINYNRGMDSRNRGELQE